MSAGPAIATPRLMLLEFLHPDPYRQFRSDEFPFIQGFVRGLGVETRWLYEVAGPDARPDSEFVIEPLPGRRAAIVAAVRAFSPTVVVANETCGPALGAALGDIPGLGRVVSIERDVPHYGAVEVGHVRDWLGLRHEGPPPRALVVDHAVPDYACAAVAPDPGFTFPMLTVIGGAPCVYRRPLRANPWFHGLDLGGVNRLGGCSFCLGDAVGTNWERQVSSPVALALLQIGRFRETAPPGRLTDRYRLFAYGVFHRIDEFFAGVLAMDLRPSEFHFSCRPDEFLGRAGMIEALLPDLWRRGHSLHVWNMGVENFSPDENARFNKGLDTALVARALDRIRGLEERWPETFVFTRHGGLSCILFTPWTTLDDLALNAREARRLGVDPVFLRSRLQVRPATPIALLVARDGLMAPRFEQESPLDFSCQCHPDEEEVPWRFRHPEVAVAYRVMLRLGDDSRIPADDPLRRSLAEMTAGLPPQARDRALILEVLADLLRAGVLGDDEIRPALEAAIASRVPAGPATPGGGPASRFRRLLAPVASGGPRTLAGYQLEGVERDSSEGEGVRLVLAAGSDRLAFSVFPDDPSRPAAVRGGGWRLVYPPTLSLDSPARVRLLKTLGTLLERFGPRLA